MNKDAAFLRDILHCQKCHFNLREHTTLRCPKCGSSLDPSETRTWHSRLLAGVQAIFLIEGVKMLVKLVGVVGLYGVLVVLFVPGILTSRCGPLSAREISRSLLHSIVQAHLLNAHLSSQDAPLTLAAINDGLAPSWYSRSLAPKYDLANQWSRRSGAIVGWCVISIGPALGTIVLTKRWLRRLATVMGLLCALLALFMLISTYAIGRFMHTSSYGYVNDYVLVPGIDWQRWAESSWDKMVGFEKNLWPGSWRVVATNPLTVRIVKEDEFQKLLSQQPLAKRAWDACLQSGECNE